MMIRRIGLAVGIAIVGVGAWKAATGSTSAGVAVLALGSLILITLYARLATHRRRNRDDGVLLLKAEILAGWFGVGLIGICSGAWIFFQGTGSDEFSGATMALGGAVFFGYGVWATWWLRRGS